MRRTPFDVPFALFVLAAGIGVWAAYDPAPAEMKFAVILAGVALYYALVFLPRKFGRFDTTRVIFAVAPAVICAYFLLAADLSYRLGKIPALDPLMQFVMLFQPRIGLPEMNTNTLGGLMAVLLPLQVQALFPNLTGRSEAKMQDLSGLRSPRAWLGVALLLLSLFALLLSASRAGWLSLAVVALFWLLQRSVGGGADTLRKGAFGIILFTLILVGAWLIAGSRILDAVATDRVPVWTGGFELATDTPFTGLGLANFAMPYSSYTLLIHVPYLTHAHNLYLDLWLETGLPGVFAFGMMLVIAFCAPMENSGWRAACIASICVMLLHGMLDDPLFAYAWPGQVFMWLPFVAVARKADAQWRPAKASLAAAGTAIALVACAIAFVPPAQAAWQANLGALAQNRIELPDYHYEKWGMQDNLRRSGAIDLTPALDHYRQALALNPNNATANRRLGQYALARGDYDVAAGYLQTAYVMTPHFRASRQLFGESLALAGDTDGAVDLWRSLNAAQGQLQQRLNWYLSFVKDNVRAERIAAVLQRMSPVTQ